MEVDPAAHLPLIQRVISQMNLSEWERDEAFSEGLVAITEAAKSYDPKYNVPVASWLAKNIRWSIKSWQLKQMYNWSQPYPEVVVAPDHQELESRAALQDLVRLIQQHLTERQKWIIVGTALGYEGKEIAKALGIGEMTVVRERRKAQAKLKEFLDEGGAG